MPNEELLTIREDAEREVTVYRYRDSVQLSVEIPGREVEEGGAIFCVLNPSEQEALRDYLSRQLART